MKRNFFFENSSSLLFRLLLLSLKNLQLKYVCFFRFWAVKSRFEQKEMTTWDNGERHKRNDLVVCGKMKIHFVIYHLLDDISVFIACLMAGDYHVVNSFELPFHTTTRISDLIDLPTASR